LQITEERKKRVIDLYFNQHKSYAEIAQIERMPPRDIHAIIKEEQARRQKYEHQQQQEELSSKAYKLFSEGKTPVQVAIILNLPASKVSKLYREYWKLRGLDKLNTVYKETNGKIWIVLKLYKELKKKRHMSIEQVVNAVEIAIHKLPHMENLYRQAKDQAEKMQRTLQRLENDIEDRKNKISILDKIAFASEQECKRTEQQIQEFGDKKNRLENLIANILSDDNEGYSKLKQILKENVKAALSEKRTLISVSFAAIIQTLKSDPQMANLIYSIPINANNGKQQHKDNNNNSIECIEANKDNILDLAEKHFGNLVEVLTINAIDNTSPNPTLSSSSSTFPNSFDQINTYKIEESESFHDSKGDIAD
jgi:ethanolamine utilization protein EutP (predicted NTPase)